MKLKKLLASVTAAALAITTMAVTSFTASAADTIDTIVDNQNQTWVHSYHADDGWWDGDKSLILDAVSFENFGDFKANGEISATWTSLTVTDENEDDVTAKCQFMLKLTSTDNTTHYDGAYSGGVGTSLKLNGSTPNLSATDAATGLSFSYAVGYNGTAGVTPSASSKLNVSITGLTITAKTSKVSNATSVTLFEGSEALGNNGEWTNLDIPAAKFANITSAGTVKVKVTNVDTSKGDWSDNMYGVAVTDPWENLQQGSNTTESGNISVSIDSETLAKFKSGGMTVNGFGFTVTKVEYISSSSSGGDVVAAPTTTTPVRGSIELSANEDNNYWDQRDINFIDLKGNIDTSTGVLSIVGNGTFQIGYALNADPWYVWTEVPFGVYNINLSSLQDGTVTLATGASVKINYCISENGSAYPEMFPVSGGTATPPSSGNDTPSNPSNPSNPSTPSASSSDSSYESSVSSGTSSITMVDSILASSADSISFNLGSNAKLDKEVLEAIAAKGDVTVKFNVAGGAYWEINGANITAAKAVDLGVRMNGTLIPESKVSELAGDKTTIQLSLRHNGDFGFTGVLNVPINKSYNGKYANLYYYNGGKFDFVGSSAITGGRAQFAFSHASNYLIVIDDYAYGEDVSSAAGMTETETTTETSTVPYVAVLVVISAFGTSAIVLKKRLSK